MKKTVIPVEKETPDYYENTGCFEHCVFCDKETDHWHKESNTPVCQGCAGSHTLSELPKAKEKSYKKHSKDAV